MHIVIHDVRILWWGVSVWCFWLLCCIWLNFTDVMEQLVHPIIWVSEVWLVQMVCGWMCTGRLRCRKDRVALRWVCNNQLTAEHATGGGGEWQGNPLYYRGMVHILWCSCLLSPNSWREVPVIHSQSFDTLCSCKGVIPIQSPLPINQSISSHCIPEVQFSLVL